MNVYMAVVPVEGILKLGTLVSIWTMTELWMPNPDPKSLLSPEAMRKNSCPLPRVLGGSWSMPPSAAATVKGATHGFHF